MATSFASLPVLLYSWIMSFRLLPMQLYPLADEAALLRCSYVETQCVMKCTLRSIHFYSKKGKYHQGGD